MHQGLIEQARTLAQLDSGKPKQVNLRRAVSSLYYAFFHYLVDEACLALIGAQHAQRGYRHSLARAFVHATMKAACSSFAAANLPPTITKPLPRVAKGNYLVAKPIQRIASVFKELQEKRHVANYELSERFRRSEVQSLIGQVDSAIQNFARLPASDDRHFFLVCLLTWRELSNR